MTWEILLAAMVAGFFVSAGVRWDERRIHRWDKAKAWQEGYRQGVHDEITSADLNHEYSPNRENPYIPEWRWWERLRHKREGKKRYDRMKHLID